MNSHRSVRLGFLIAIAVALAWVVITKPAVLETFTARVLAPKTRVQKKQTDAFSDSTLSQQGPFTARIIASRGRVQPGGIVDFKFELIDSEGRAQSVVGLTRHSGLTPQLALYDSQGQEIGTYSFQFG